MRLFVFDIETGSLPVERIQAVAPEFDPESVKVGNLGLEKSMEKINAAREIHLSRIIDKAALHAEYGQVLAIGTLAFSDKGEEFDILHGSDEALLIERFWELASKADASGSSLVGHNIFGFDLPFLVRRSYLHSIAPPCQLLPSRGRYWNRPWFDTMSAWSLGEYQARISLDRFAKHLGLEGKSGSGKYFAKLYEENQKEALDYLRTDLKVSKRIAERIIPLLQGSEVGQ